MYVALFLLFAYIASVAFVRTRNTDKFEFVRQLSDFSTFMVPFNLPAYLLSRIPITPRVDKSHFPKLQVLEDNWQVIRDEALALYEQGYVKKGDDLPGSSFYKDNRWKSFYLKSYKNSIPSAYQLAPKTMALINQVPNLNLAVFAALMPGKELKRHHDPFAYTLRYSLGLSTPNSPKCGLIIDGEPYHWQDGDAVMFDETYMHSAYNHTDKIRLILMTDIDRPLHLKLIQKAYYYFGLWFNRFFAVDNLDPSLTAIGNKWGKGITAYSAAMKRFKYWNKPLYVFTKVAVLFLLLAYVFSKLV